jgi:hypothetical protein
MVPDALNRVQSMLARYTALLQAEQVGPPNAERRARLRGLAEYLRTHHAALLAEADRQVQSARGAPATPAASPLAEGSGPVVKAAVASQEPEGPPAGVKYIDPQLAEKLRDQLLKSLQGPTGCQ